VTVSPAKGRAGHPVIAPGSIFVIGYGNELRGDDAAGPRAAAAVAEWGLPGLEVLVRHQLTPELSEPLAKARAVIFLDAAAASKDERAQAVPLDPSSQAELTVHRSDPRALLALAQALFGRAPKAWLVRIPALRFEFGAPLSPIAARGLADALAQVRELLACLR
jgi:hydrogenase maturation protease